MARKDNGANDESPEPLVSKGTAGEDIDDLGVPVDDDVVEDETTAGDVIDDETAASAKKGPAGKASDAKDADESGATAGLDDVPFELAEDTPDPTSCRRPVWSRNSSTSAIARPRGSCRTVSPPRPCAARTSWSRPP